MFGFLKRLFGREEISEKAIEHSSKGEYSTNGRMKGGGHGQEAIDYMDMSGIEYNITKIYPNGVRLGNVPSHNKRWKRTGENQTWFPKEWNRHAIKAAGQKVAKGKKYPDGKTKIRTVNGVDVGIKRTNGKIATVFPLREQNEKRRRK